MKMYKSEEEYFIVANRVCIRTLLQIVNGDVNDILEALKFTDSFPNETILILQFYPNIKVYSVVDGLSVIKNAHLIS